jgi:hypothetical protein
VSNRNARIALSGLANQILDTFTELGLGADKAGEFLMMVAASTLGAQDAAGNTMTQQEQEAHIAHLHAKLDEFAAEVQQKLLGAPVS